MCRGQPVAQEAEMPEAAAEEHPEGQATLEAASAALNEGTDVAPEESEDTTHASSSSRSHLPGTEAKEPEVPMSTELAAKCTAEAGEEAEEAMEVSISEDPAGAEAQETAQVPSNEGGTTSVGEDAAGEGSNVQAGEEAEEAMEVSISEDPAGTAPNAFTEDEEEMLFTIDPAGEAALLDAPPEEDVPTQKETDKEEGEQEADEADAEKTQATCATCGLFGHDASACPFAHPEDIDLGDLEESDSDDELAELYPLFSRYVQQHIGALTPKDRKGLTGGGRYFGQEKHQACWACAEVGHDANDCPDKGCFFCSKKGHESRECPQRSLRCSHCNLRGHAPVSCPTLAAIRLADFSHVRCMRCGTLGHPNCGVPPKAPDVAQPGLSAREEADKQQMLQQIAAGRARTRAWDTAPWRSKPDLEMPKAKMAKVSKVDVPVPDLLLQD